MENIVDLSNAGLGSGHSNILKNPEKCGEPLMIGRRQDVGIIWIYYEDQSNFMYYLPFMHGRLQRVVGAPCNPDQPDCLDLRDN